MQRIEVDFSARRPPPITGWLLLLVGILTLVAVLAFDRLFWPPRIAADEARLRQAQAALAQRRPATAKGGDPQRSAEWSRASAVAEELNRPWERLFAVFEGEAERPVALLSFEPDVVKGELVLSAEARDFDAMLAYYRALQRQDVLSDVVLHAHRVNRQDTEQPVRFRISAKWPGTGAPANDAAATRRTANR